MVGDQELKTFKVTLSTYSDSAERLRSRVRKFFRRRAKSMVEQEPDRLKVEMRNGTEIYCKLNNHSRGKYSSEPIAEMVMTTTASYLEYSVRATRRHAEKSNLHIRIDTQEEKPRK